MKSFFLIVFRILALFLLWKAGVSQLFTFDKQNHVAILTDYSNSFHQGVRDRLLSDVESKVSTAKKDYFDFAEQTYLQEKDNLVGALSNKLKDNQKNRTNLELALRSALKNDPSAIFLISDGNQNAGDVLNLSHEIEAKKIPIYAFTENQEASSNKVKILSFSAPLVIGLEKKGVIRTNLKNFKSTQQKINLEIIENNESLLKSELELVANEEKLLVTESNPKNTGLSKLTLNLNYEDSSGPHLESKTIFISREKPESVLLLSGTSEDDRFFSSLLKDAAYKVQNELADPNTQHNLDEFQVVILNNVPKEKLAPNLEDGLKYFVESGKGLVIIGGDKSYGLGGYLGTELAELFPVEPVPPQGEKKRVDLAVLLVIDKSESMRHDSRIEFAKEAAKQVILNLKPADYIGVIGFDLTPFVVVNIGKLSAVRDYALKQIEDLYPTRITRLYPALTEALAQLQGVKAGRKHMIVLTDGKLPDEDELGREYESLVKQMRFTGITLSTVLIGDPNLGDFLRRLANIGGGAHYQTQNPSSLPRIFLNDVQVVSGEKTLKESEQFEVITGPQGIRSTTISEFPPLRGYVETKPRQGADIELQARGSMAADPLLASWKRGSGRVIAFTSDANGRWSSNWVPWSRFRQFWTEIIDTAKGDYGNKAKPPEFDLRTIFSGGKVKLDLAVYGELAGTLPKFSVTFPDQSQHEFAFSEIESGHYQTKDWDIISGIYKGKITAGQIEFPEVAWEVDQDILGESPDLGVNYELLSKLAEISHGKINPSSNEIRIVSKEKRNEGSVNPMYLYFAFLAFLLELSLRIIKR